MREYDVDTGRLRLSVRDHAGRMPPLVCLHGLASNARWWDLVARRVAPRRRVVAVDQRGHGRSDRPAGGYGFDDVVADLAALQAALGLGRAVVAGHSWGASVALCHAAAAGPGGVAGVICVDGRAAAERALAALGDGGELRWIPGGHDLPVQRPAEVAAALAAFADRVAPLGPGAATHS